MRGYACKRLALTALVVVGLGGAPTWALTDEEIFRDFRFNFINPGARSVGLGGAYIAAASDATAAEANPAALHYVSRSEAFVEFRVERFDPLVSRPSFNPGTNDPGSPDFVDFTSFNTQEDDEFLSFVSFAQPFKLGRQRATLAFSRQVVLSVENSLSAPSGQATTLEASNDRFPLFINNGAIERYLVRNSVQGVLDAELVHYNAGFSISLTRHFSLGVTATLAQLDMQSNVLGVAEDPLGVLDAVNPRVNVGGVLSPIRQTSTIDDDDQAFGFAVGLHWHPDDVFPSRGLSPVRFGVVYRRGAELGVNQVVAEEDTTTGLPTVTEQFENVLKVPDRFGVGFAYELGTNWLFSLDAERVLYSDLLDDFRAGQNFFTSGVIPQSLIPLDPDSLVFDVDDGTVVHAGVEFNFVSRGSWNHAVRMGYYNQPDNRIRLTDVSFTTPNPELEAIYKDLFRGGEEEDHFTVGFSINTPVGLTLQAAGDFSEDNEAFVMSTIYRFGRIRR